MGKASRRKALPSAENGVERDRPKRSRGAGSGITMSWVPYALILVTTVVLYANSFSIPFLFDDHFEIVNNEEIRDLESPVAYLTRPRGANDFTLALNYRWGGLDVWGYHFVNVAIHIVNGWLAYALALAILRLPFFAGRYRQRDRDLATLIALVFVAHPLQTMAASYLIQRAESLSAMFYLGSVLLFTHASTVEGGVRLMLFYIAILGGDVPRHPEQGDRGNGSVGALAASLLFRNLDRGRPSPSVCWPLRFSWRPSSTLSIWPATNSFPTPAPAAPIRVPGSSFRARDSTSKE